MGIPLIGYPPTVTHTHTHTFCCMTRARISNVMCHAIFFLSERVEVRGGC